MEIEKENPLISCITPTFNRAHLLPRTIESTINQTYTNWEMIIVDDGSKDNTEEVVRNYMKKDERIRYFKNPGKGGNAARNYGIKQAKGEWIAFLDDDVENLPKRFELQYSAAMKSDSEFIVSGFISIGKNGKKVIKNNGLWGMAAGITSRFFIKKEILFKAGLFDEEMLAMQENELTYRIAPHTIFVNHLQLVTREYLTTNSVSQGMKSVRASERLLDKHEKIMDKREASWWYYKIGLGHYKYMSNIKISLININKAKELFPGFTYTYIYNYILIIGWIRVKPLIKIHLKIIKFLYSIKKFPKVINHQIVIV